MAATMSEMSWKGPTPFGSVAVGSDCGSPEPAGGSGLSGAVCASGGFSNRWSFHIHYDDFADAYDDFGGSSCDPACSDYDDVVSSSSGTNLGGGMGARATTIGSTLRKGCVYDEQQPGEMQDCDTNPDDEWRVDITEETTSNGPFSDSLIAFDLGTFESLMSGVSDGQLEGDLDKCSSNPLMSSSTQWLAQGLSLPAVVSRKKTSASPASYKTAAEKYLDNDKAGKTGGTTLCRQWEEDEEDWGAMGSVASFGTTSSRLSSEPEHGSVVTTAISIETKKQLNKLQKTGSIQDTDKKSERRISFADSAGCPNAMELAGCSSSNNKLLSGLSQLPTTLDGDDERLEEVIRQRTLGREALAMAIGTILARAAVQPSTSMSADQEDDRQRGSLRIILPSSRGARGGDSDVTVYTDDDGDEGMFYEDDHFFQPSVSSRETDNIINSDAMMSIECPRNAWTLSSLQHWWSSTSSNNYHFGSSDNESPVRCWNIRVESTMETQESSAPGLVSENDTDMMEDGGAETTDARDRLIERMALATAKFLLSGKEYTADEGLTSEPVGYDVNMDDGDFHSNSDQTNKMPSRMDRTPPLQYFQGSGGLMLLVMSLVESRGFARIRSDMQDPTAAKLLTTLGDASTELVKLVSTGKATSPPSASLTAIASENDQMGDTVKTLPSSENTTTRVFGSGLRVKNRRSFSSLEEEEESDGVDAETLRQRPWMASLVNSALRPTKRARVVGVLGSGHPNHFPSNMLPQPLPVPGTPTNVFPGQHAVRAS